MLEGKREAMAEYIYNQGGSIHGYFEGDNVYRNGKRIYYRDGNYLFEHGTGKPIAYQNGKWFYDPNTGKGLFYLG